MSAVSVCVTVAFATGARVVGRDVVARGADLAGLERLLSNLAELGHVAAFEIAASQPAEPFAAFVDRLQAKLGVAVVNVALATPAPRGPAPAYLVPVWPFDHERDGNPASSGRMLGLDLAFGAVPSSDEERGVVLTGRPGRWLIHAQPLPT